jgi:hypothetical protein
VGEAVGLSVGDSVGAGVGLVVGDTFPHTVKQERCCRVCSTLSGSNVGAASTMNSMRSA